MGTVPRELNGAKKEKVFINRKHYDKDFSGEDLTHADFRGSTLVNCNFDNADLSYATFEGANCYRSSFRQTKCYHTNFKDAVLAETKLDPRDMFGMTISVSCDTFDKMELGKMWLAAWLYLPMLAAIPPENKKAIEEVLVGMLGAERVKTLERTFAQRAL